MGRGPDGEAKIINVDENGNVKVQQSGTNVDLIVSHSRRADEIDKHVAGRFVITTTGMYDDTLYVNHANAIKIGEYSHISVRIGNLSNKPLTNVRVGLFNTIPDREYYVSTIARNKQVAFDDIPAGAYFTADISDYPAFGGAYRYALVGATQTSDVDDGLIIFEMSGARV